MSQSQVRVALDNSRHDFPNDFNESVDNVLSHSMWALVMLHHGETDFDDIRKTLKDDYSKAEQSYRIMIGNRE